MKIKKRIEKHQICELQSGQCFAARVLGKRSFALVSMGTTLPERQNGDLRYLDGVERKRC